MKIPKSFQMMGHTITVFFDPELVQREDNKGQAHTRRNTIILQTPTKDNKQTTVEHTFWHEKLHFALRFAGMGERLKEKEVDLLAGLLHQAQITEK